MGVTDEELAAKQETVNDLRAQVEAENQKRLDREREDANAITMGALENEEQRLLAALDAAKASNENPPPLPHEQVPGPDPVELAKQLAEDAGKAPERVVEQTPPPTGSVNPEVPQGDSGQGGGPTAASEGASSATTTTTSEPASGGVFGKRS